MGLFEQLFYILLAITVVIGLIIAYLGFCIYDLHKQLKLVSSTKILYTKWNILIVITNILLKGVNSEIPVDQIPIKYVRTSVIKAIGKQVIIKALATTGVLLVAAVISGALSFVVYQYQQQLNAAITAISTLFDDETCQCYAKCTNDSKDDEKTAYELVYGPDEYNKLTSKMNCTEAELDGFTPYTEIEDSGNGGGSGGGSGSDPDPGDGSSGDGSSDLKELRVAFDIDGTLDTSKGSHNKETLRDGAVEAIQSLENAGVDYVIITAASDTNRKKEWLNTEIFSKLTSKSHYQGFYSVDAGEKRATWLKNNNYNVLVDDRSNSRKKAESKGINTLDPTKISLKNITKELEKFVDTNKVAYVQTTEVPILARTDAKKAIDYIRTAKSKGETVKAENVDYSTVDPTGEIQYRWVDCLNGQQKNYFITQHLNSDILEAYKAVIMDNDLGIHDNIDRKHLNEEQLRDDLKKFLSDYKKNGRNPVCPCCKNLGSEVLGHRCKGADHYYKRREFQGVPVENRLISGNKTPSWNEPGVQPPNNRTKMGKATGQYAVQLDDGTYYWYHQSSPTCGCIHCGKNNPGGMWTEKHWGTDGNGSKFGSDGCAEYSLAIGISNIMGQEITPDDIFNMLGATVTNSNYITGPSPALSNRSILRGTAAQKLNEALGSQGFSMERIGGLDQIPVNDMITKIDEVLDKGGIVWGSWDDKGTNGVTYVPWCGNGSRHFMCIRKKAGDSYYCFTSCRGKCTNNAGKVGAIETMNHAWSKTDCVKDIGVSPGGWEMYAIYGPTIEDGGGNTNPSSEGVFEKLSETSGSYNFNGVKTDVSISDGSTIPVYDGVPAEWGWNKGMSATVWHYQNTAAAWCENFSSETGLSSCTTYHDLNKEHNRTTNSAISGVKCLEICTTAAIVKCGFTPSNTAGVNDVSSSAKGVAAIIIAKSGSTYYYIPCKVTDAKAHTYPGGIVQTSCARYSNFEQCYDSSDDSCSDFGKGHAALHTSAGHYDYSDRIASVEIEANWKSQPIPSSWNIVDVIYAY